MKAKIFVEINRKITADLHLLPIDFYTEISNRRPDDWNGSLSKFKAFAKDGDQVPALISADGGHPSYPARFNGYSADVLNRNDYRLRSMQTLRAYADVINRVLNTKEK